MFHVKLYDKRISTQTSDIAYICFLHL